jgi:hypothetical protein
MTFNYTVTESPWVTLRQGDPSFTLQGPLTLASRAGIQINQGCPSNIANDINWAMQHGFIEAVATVPRDDPTYMWETLKR